MSPTGLHLCQHDQECNKLESASRPVSRLALPHGDGPHAWPSAQQVLLRVHPLSQSHPVPHPRHYQERKCV